MIPLRYVYFLLAFLAAFACATTGNLLAECAKAQSGSNELVGLIQFITGALAQGLLLYYCWRAVSATQSHE